MKAVQHSPQRFFKFGAAHPGLPGRQYFFRPCQQVKLEQAPAQVVFLFRIVLPADPVQVALDNLQQRDTGDGLYCPVSLLADIPDIMKVEPRLPGSISMFNLSGLAVPTPPASWFSPGREVLLGR
jgi:hypothetical protein